MYIPIYAWTVYLCGGGGAVDLCGIPIIGLDCLPRCGSTYVGWGM